MDVDSLSEEDGINETDYDLDYDYDDDDGFMAAAASVLRWLLPLPALFLSETGQVVLWVSLSAIICLTSAPFFMDLASNNAIPPGAPTWGFGNSLYFVITMLTGVGYGDLYPTNDDTRIFFFFFILGGLVVVIHSSSLLTVWYLRAFHNLVGNVKALARWGYRKVVSDKLLKDSALVNDFKLKIMHKLGKESSDDQMIEGDTKEQDGEAPRLGEGGGGEGDSAERDLRSDELPEQVDALPVVLYSRSDDNIRKSQDDVSADSSLQDGSQPVKIAMAAGMSSTCDSKDTKRKKKWKVVWNARGVIWRQLKRKDGRWGTLFTEFRQSFYILAIMAGVMIIAGICFYLTEPYSYLTSTYLALTTLYGLGMGDANPTTPAGKVFACLYAVVGVGLLSRIRAEMEYGSFLRERDSKSFEKRKKRMATSPAIELERVSHTITWLITNTKDDSAAKKHLTYLLEYIDHADSDRESGEFDGPPGRQQIPSSSPHSSQGGEERGERMVWMVFRFIWQHVVQKIVFTELCLVCIVSIILVLIGAEIFMQLEGVDDASQQIWTYGNCVYFTVNVLTRVAYGDFHPTNDNSRVFFLFYVFFGLLIVGICMAQVCGLIIRDVEWCGERIQALWYQYRAYKHQRAIQHVAEERKKKKVENEEQVERGDEEVGEARVSLPPPTQASIAVTEPSTPAQGDTFMSLSKRFCAAHFKLRSTTLSLFARFMMACVFWLIILWLGTLAFDIAEHDAQGLSFVESLYLSTVTVAGLGLGDIVPVTPQGKVASGILGFFGVGFLTLALAEMDMLFFWHKTRRRRRAELLTQHGPEGLTLFEVEKNIDALMAVMSWQQVRDGLRPLLLDLQASACGAAAPEGYEDEDECTSAGSEQGEDSGAASEEEK